MHTDNGPQRPRRYQPLLLVLRYGCVALLGVVGVALVVAGQGLNAGSLDKPPDAIAAEKTLFLLFGFFLTGTALVLAWLNGAARRWLFWAAVAVALAPIVTLTSFVQEHDGTFQRTSNALYSGLLFIVCALICAVLCYPASRLGRRRLRWGIAWLVGWLGVLLGCTVVGLLLNAAAPHNPNRSGMLVSAVLCIGLAAVSALLAWLLVRGTRAAMDSGDRPRASLGQ